MDKPQITPDQLTAEDVAHYLRRDAAVVQRWLEDGLLPGYSLPGGHWLIMRDDLDTFLTAHRHQANEHGRITRLRRELTQSRSATCPRARRSSEWADS